jgi:hypothetical protein
MSRFRRARLALLVVTVGFVLSACKDDFIAHPGDGGVSEFSLWPEASVGPCVPGKDSDGDRIPDEVEGCTADTDGDKIPDYADSDSDNDKVTDALEAGPDPAHPVDTDGDGVPDYQDNDSDGDGVMDGDEDLSKDGLLGCCLSTCGEVRQGCKPEASGCGAGQKCEGGKCLPAADFLCSNGETDPKKKNTFGQKADQDLPTFVCHKPDETSGKGLKPMQFQKSSQGKWKIAIEKASTYGEISIAGADALEAGASFDLATQDRAVAGFIVSLPAPSADAVKAVGDIIAKLGSLSGAKQVTQLSSGAPRTSHDKFPTVVSTQLRVEMSSGANPPAVRNAVFPALLGSGKTLGQLPAAGFGPTSTAFRLHLQTLIRKDGRALVMGAVADAAMADDLSLPTGFHLDDLSNGTGLTTEVDTDTVECDPFLPVITPTADIIWVVDESGSMENNRNEVASNATDFFSRALKSGVDFRMGVTGVGKTQDGRFCSQISTDSHDSGGTDRFLLPGEQAIFEACVKNPPGYEGSAEYNVLNARRAVENHLPRTPGDDPSKIRPDATLVVIIVTDEADQGWKDGVTGASDYKMTCTLPGSIQQSTDALFAPDLKLFLGQDAQWGHDAWTTVHQIGGLCDSECFAEVAHGSNEVVNATGGIIGDVCQADLGATLQIMIDTIAGSSSPVVLQYVPISASLAVAVEKNQLERSRKSGFDYVSSANSLVFIGVPFPKGSQVVASYRRWVAQALLE